MILAASRLGPADRWGNKHRWNENRSCGPDRWGFKHRWNGKKWENGTKQVKTALWVTAAKLNFDLDRGKGDKVGHANFHGCSSICTHPRVEKQWENGTKQVKTALSGYGGEAEFLTLPWYGR